VLSLIGAQRSRENGAGLDNLNKFAPEIVHQKVL
jgi:hypothetical protein